VLAFAAMIEPLGALPFGLCASGEKRLAVPGMTGIQHARDIGVGERGKNLPLLKKSHEWRIASAWRHQLHH
jgi:hypothetical protein